MSKYIIPLSILVAGSFVGIAIYLSKSAPAMPADDADKKAEKINLAPVTSRDHILGDPNADIVIVEYSDYECPYCQQFHSTMKTVMAAYGSEGKVAWVFRHFPLDEIHPLARESAIASECVSTISGNDAFWNYSDKLFEGQPDTLSPSELRRIAVELGVDGSAFDTCVVGEAAAKAVDEDYQDGLRVANGDPKFGTPYNVFVSKTGTQMAVAGAYPYAYIKQVIDTMLAETRPVAAPTNTATSSN